MYGMIFAAMFSKICANGYNEKAIMIEIPHHLAVKIWHLSSIEIDSYHEMAKWNRK
jgi:hypothetical protein